MNTRTLIIGFAALAISASAFANDIYKWTDENGNVHYEDRPSGQASEQRLQLSYNRTNAKAVEGRVQQQQDTANTRRLAKEEANAAELTAAEERAAAEQKLAQVRCPTCFLHVRHCAYARRVHARSMRMPMLRSLLSCSDRVSRMQKSAKSNKSRKSH